MSAIANPSDPVLPSPDRTIVIIGMPGSGKSSVGRKLAAALKIPFFDADDEVETAAGMTIEQIFQRLGEAEFRKGERRVIARLLEGPVHVLATGGGAFMDPETRALVRSRAVSLWLRADMETLMERTSRRNNRPLLKQGDPGEALKKLFETRVPVYAQADITVDSDDRPPEETVSRIIKALNAFAPSRVS
ncbi:MAG: shikimate kinase [Bdellovibrionales bacterium]